MAQHDYNIANQSFPSFRSDLNSVLEAINTSNSGTSRPSSAVAGTIWLDTTSASSPTLKFYDGSDDISLATLDYTANTVNWLDSTVSVNIVSDTTPQLGGNLDVNGNSIVSVANGNITITPDGTGKVIVDGLSFPTSDGSADQVLKTDGSGNLSFADASGGGTQWQSSIVTGTTLSAVAGNGYWINTTSNACTVTLPASASVGDTIEFSDYLRTWGTNAVTLNQNSLNFQGYTSPNPEYNTNGQSVRIVYSGATQGWIPSVDDDVTLETPQTYSADFLVVAGGGATSGNTSGYGGGGGAGGFRTSTQTVNVGTTITVTVGDGGSGVASTTTRGGNGSNSSISGTGLTTITSAGGGAAGVDGGGNVNGNDGGSGGGASGSGGGTPTGGTGNTPSTSPSQGNNGGNGSTSGPNYGGGGGGGAGAVGGNGTSTSGGNGGNGTASSITGSAVTYAGGGGGMTTGGGTPGSGGTGGGGNAGNPGTAGTQNLGGGAGGTAANGGKGVVILSVPTADYTGTTTGSPTVTTSGSNTIMQFNGSGSYTA